MTFEGPNDAWWCFGADKFPRYDFAIWGLRDAYSQKWLGLWVIPTNRLEVIVSYFWLKTVREVGGIPRQTSSPVEGGTQHAIMEGLARALREASSTESPFERPVHTFLRSVESVPIRRHWLEFTRGFEDDFSRAPAATSLYNPSNPTHRYIINWLLPPVIQKELDKLRELTNNARLQGHPDKSLPEGATPDIAYVPSGNPGRPNCMQTADTEVVDELLNDLEAGGVVLTDWEVPAEVSRRAHEIMALLNVSLEQVDMSNVWLIFAAIIGVLHDRVEPVQ